MKERIFGDIKGFYEGDTFKNRIDLSLSGIHRPIQAGISGSQIEGADSIVLSGGYEDDEDYGDIVIYTGHGGRDLKSGKQVADQQLKKQNLALAISCQQGLPVRVIRGENHKSSFSPDQGYRFDGLYRIEDYWKEIGINGLIIWRFKLRKIIFEDIDNQLFQENIVEENQSNYKNTQRIQSQVSRIIRDTALSRQVKEMYQYSCQVCRLSIITNSGLYAEAAHIKPLGIPHNGPDTLSNLLCLCPNHHVKFDFGGFTIEDDFTLVGEPGVLTINVNHKIEREFLEYHRVHFYEEND